MTSIASGVSSASSNSDAAFFKRAANKSLANAQRSSGVELKFARELVDNYVEGLLNQAKRSVIEAEGERCSWMMGCPALENPKIRGIRGMSDFGRIENDHAYPVSRLPPTLAGSTAARLCRYHNIYWKNAHIAFSLPDRWLNTQEVEASL